MVAFVRPHRGGLAAGSIDVPGSPSQQGMNAASFFDIEAVSLDHPGHGEDCERGHHQ